MSALQDDRPSHLKSNDWEGTRRWAIRRNGYECVFCGTTNIEHRKEQDQDLHVHPIVPRSKNGSDEPENLIPVCSSCHRTVEAVTDILLENIGDGEPVEKDDFDIARLLALANNSMVIAQTKADNEADTIQDIRGEILDLLEVFQDGQEN